MKARRFCSAFVLILLFIGSTPVARSGIIITEDGGEKTLISKGKIKEISGDADVRWQCFDAKAGTILQVNSGSRTYSKGTTREYCEASSLLFEESMKNMPPEQRKMIEDGMQKSRRQEKAKVSITKAGAGGTIAGYTTEKYKIMVDGSLHEEVWIASSPAIMKEIPDAEMMARFMREFQHCMSSGKFDVSNEPEFSTEYLSMMKEGLTLKNVRYQNGHGEIGTEVVSVEQKDLPASEFEPPAGYKKLTILEMLHSGERGDEDEQSGDEGNDDGNGE